MADREERTFIMVKPDGVQRGLVGEIMERFEQRGYKLVALKMITPVKELLEMHYQELRDRPFFPKLMAYMSSGPVVAMVWEGLDVVSQGRAMLGATDPLKSAPGTIRGDFSLATGRNICHGSDSKASAHREISLWFRDEELSAYENQQHSKWMSTTLMVLLGYDALRSELDRWSAEGGKGRLVLLFLSDHVDGKGWCPDCVAVEPLVEQALNDAEVAAASDLTFVTVFVGQRDPWKDKTNAFRTSPDLLVNSIPTLLEYGNLDRRLGDKECTSVETIKNFILGKKI